jgi:cytochrome P450
MTRKARSIFTEANRLDVRRDARRHVAFGDGIHHCLGASLARLEGQVALSALIARFDRLELAGRASRGRPSPWVASNRSGSSFGGAAQAFDDVPACSCRPLRVVCGGGGTPDAR